MVRRRTIPAPTELSIQQTATILQKLVNLRTNHDADTSTKLLPEHIESCVNKLLNAQTEFAESIDEYLHLIDSRIRKEDEFETVSTIVET